MWVKGYVTGLPEDIRKEKDQIVEQVANDLDVVPGKNVNERLEQFRSSFEDARPSISRLDKPPYKAGKVKWQACRWVRAGSSVNDAALADLMSVLRVIPANPGEASVTADDFDAVLCSLVGILPEEYGVSQEVLENLVRTKVAGDCGCDLVPPGYRLLSRLPEGQKIVLDAMPVGSCEEVLSLVEQLVEPELPKPS